MPAKLPVADGCVLAHRALLKPRERAVQLRGLRQVIHAVQMAEAHRDQVVHVEFRRGCAGAQGVRAHIAELVGIRLIADAAGIEYDQKNTFHMFAPFSG